MGLFKWWKRQKIKRVQKQLKTLSAARLNHTVTSEALQKEITLYFELATLYESLLGEVKLPFAREQALACYRAAAALDNAQAQFLVGQKLLEEARMREELESGGLFASDANAAFLKVLYHDVHAFLLAAEKHQHIKAKRVRGLCYINGWGVPVDKDAGFDLVVASIEQENSWDRVQKIFAELGINKSAFFSELFQHRKK
jgi:TPR repeat protein